MLQSFAFTNVATFEQNLAAFAVQISTLNAQCVRILAAALPLASDARTLKEALLDKLLTVLDRKHPMHAATGTA